MYTFESKCKILSGENAYESMSFEINEKNLKKPLIISEKIVKELGFLKKILKNFDFYVDSNSIYFNISNNSTAKSLNELVQKYRDGEYDSIIAIGRSSVICLAKALKYLINTDSENIENFNKVSGKNEKTYLFVVPIFLGCTEEATAETTIYDIEKHRTYIIKNGMCEPNCVFIDKRSLDIVPSSVLVNICSYALIIALEAYTSKDTNCLIQTYAETAIKLIKENINKVLQSPSKLKLQTPLVEAIVYAGIAKSKINLSIIDVIVKVISRLKQIPKEYVMFSIFLENSLLFIEDKEKLENLLPSYSGEEIASKTLDTDKSDFTLYSIQSDFKSLSTIYNLPKNLSGLGVKRSDFQKIAEEVKFDIDTKKINKDISVQDIQDILNKIYSEE